MGAIRVDESRFPVIIVTFEDTVPDAEFDAYLARLDAHVARRIRCAFVFDATRAGRSSATQRRKQADWMRANEHVLRTYSAGYAFVISSPLIRGALTAILWLQPMPAPHVVVPTFEEAERWARGQLEDPSRAA